MRSEVKIFTIGFTKKTAEEFFTRLMRAGVRRVIDIRLNNVSQLAGFTKRDDLRYFLQEIGGIDYMHRPDLAPTQEILDAFQKNNGSWSVYERDFLALLAEREAEKAVAHELLYEACLLCSEEKPTQCHRRLVAEYLRSKWGDVEIVHL
jgi:uncharacterized protein (DUF488 family)